MTTLKKGAKGAEVKTLQSYLNLTQDGIFGSLTEEAVKSFQTSKGLVADGIVGEKTWAALKGAKKLTTRKINSIILHCTATPEGRDYDVDTIRKWHRAVGWNDIGYHYLIYRDGTVHDGRDINVIGAHCTGHNTGSIGICYVGGVAEDARTPKDTRTAAQRKALVSLVKQLMADYKLNASQVHCHNEYTNKACPSFKIDSFRKEL